MPVETTSGVPAKFYAGDTVRFTWGHTDYPATDWTLSFALKNPLDLTTSYLAVAGAADGDDFIVTLTTAQTAALRPGLYIYALIVTETATTEKVTAQSGTLRILPSVLSNTKGPRRTAYEAARTALEGLAAKTFASVSVEGESYTLQTVGELTALVDRLYAEALQEDAELGLPVAGGVRRIRYRM